MHAACSRVNIAAVTMKRGEAARDYSCISITLEYSIVPEIRIWNAHRPQECRGDVAPRRF